MDAEEESGMCWKRAMRYAGVFALVLVVCVTLALLVCHIPQSAIEQNSRISADMLMQQEAFPLLCGDWLNSRADNYADSNLLNVIYHTDSDHPFHSFIAAPYYRVEGESAQENYYQAAVLGYAPNSEYARYWHGSQVLVRPLLTFTTITGVRLILFGLLLALNAWLVALLLRHNQRRIACIYIAGLVAVSFWMTAASLEYIMTFLVMTAVCIAACRICLNGDDAALDCRLVSLFILSGAVTCFVDFLTTETLAFTVPFVLCLMIRKQQGRLDSFRQEFWRMVRCGAAWLAAYAAMFAVKWGLVLSVLGRDAFLNALSSAALRMDGSIQSAGLSAMEAGSLGMQTSGALLRNLACLFPVSTQVTVPVVLLLVFGGLAIFGAVFYLFRRDPVDGSFLALLALAAAIPYVRFVCLSNHSYIHYFFTYRAQMASVMAALGMLAYSTGPVKKKKRPASGRKG